MQSTSSPIDIRGRRLALKRQRQLRILQTLWRSLLVSSLAGGLIWASFLPKWTIRQLKQVEIQGNEYLSADVVKGLVQETASQPIFTLTPQTIERILKNQAPIAQVSVARKLYPPQVTIAIKERHPIAETLPDPTAINPLEKGYLDAQGMWMSQDNYRSAEDFPTPTLKVIGYRPHYSLQWAKLYPHLQTLPITIKAVNWQDPSNLILETELGEVHLGGNLESLPEQLDKLAQLKNLPQKLPPQQIRRINLKNSDFILIEEVSE